MAASVAALSSDWSACSVGARSAVTRDRGPDSNKASRYPVERNAAVYQLLPGVRLVGAEPRL